MTISTSVPLQESQATTLRPSFIGLIKGEMFKLVRQRSNWYMLIAVNVACCIAWLTTLFISTTKDDLLHKSYAFLFTYNTASLGIFRALVGFFLIVMTARMVGLDYQQGTIRIILARGAGRLALLAAKFLTVVIAALVILIIGLIVNALMALLIIGIVTGNFDALKPLDAAFWSASWTFIVTIMISMGVTILLAMATTVLGRSQAFGLGFALIFFPADNFAINIMGLIYRASNNNFWLKLTTYVLGPNLNAMPQALIPGITIPGTKQLIQPVAIGDAPFQPVDATHTLLVTLVFALVFLAIPIILTWRRDVME